MKTVGKVLKFVLKAVMWIVVGLVAVVLLAALTLPLWIGPVATGVANNIVPDIVKTDFHLGRFELNPYTGRMALGDMQLANPDGFPKENCVELGNLKVELEVCSTWTKKIHVEEIVLDGLTVSTTVTGANFKSLADNASGGEPPPGEPTADGTTPAKPEGEGQKPGQESGEAPKVVIDRLTLKNVIVKLNGVPIPVPTITLEGIGADKEDGASWADAWMEVVNKVMSSVGALGGMLGELGMDTLSAGAEAANAVLGAGADAVGSAIESLQNADYSAATDAIVEGAEAVADSLKVAEDAFKDSAKELRKSAKDTAKDVKRFFKDNKKKKK